MNRGRPAEATERPSKRKYVYHEVPTKPELGETSTWYYDEEDFKLSRKRLAILEI